MQAECSALAKHNPSEIILMFAAQEIFLLIINIENVIHCFSGFRIL